MGTFQLLNFILFFFYFSLAHATQYCQIEVRDVAPNDSRARQVVFPDGREITIVGHVHGDRSLPMDLQNVTVTPVTDLSNELFLQKLSSLAGTLHSSRQHLPADQNFLKSLLQTQTHVQFIGFESTNAITQNNIHHYSLLHAGVMQNLKLRGLELSQDLKDLLLVAVGPIASLRILEPDLFNGRSILGFESEVATQDYSLASAQVDEVRSKLNKASQGDQTFQVNIEGTDLQLWHEYDHYVPERDETLFFNSIASANIPPAYRELTLEWSRARLKEMAALKKRERDVVDNMVATGMSGVLFMGHKHLVSISQMLAQRCQNTY